MSEDSMRVAVRVRPQSKSEEERGCRVSIERVQGEPQVRVNGDLCFTFNYVYDAHSTQAELYRECVSEMLDKLFCGFNATILAYGQTGSGKTYTMGTAYEGESSMDIGVIPRAIQDIFERIENLGADFDFKVTCSFIELYQEQLYDLLSTKGREQSVVELREDRNGIVMSGLIEEEVYTACEATDCLMRGSSGRTVGSTTMNEQSSRSHAIFTVNLQATHRNKMKTVITSKFHLVDLAGSERCQKTQATGDRFKEGVKINQGLLALGNVISILGSPQSSGFVRYRDSKLTRLLQDSLGGNSITLMIACVSPADYNINETLSTLRYADRARKIKNKPIVNQDPHAAQINHLNSIIETLRSELAAAGVTSTLSLGQSGSPLKKLSVSKSSDGAVEEKLYQELKEKYKNLQAQLQSTLHSVVEIEMRAHIAEAANEKVKAHTEKMKLIVAELDTDLDVENLDEMKASMRGRMEDINQLFANIDEIFVNTALELSDNHRNCCTNDSHVSDDDIKEIMQEQVDVYTSKQIGFSEQLRRINRELDLKEQLFTRVAGNLTQICTLDNNIEEKFKECESKIHDLETERNELMDMLRHAKDKTSAKLAEERRKRVQALEHQINEMKRKNLQQAKLLKVREKETQKIKILQSEIQSMKESKVKLIRSMRNESENFRQWKLTREKELMQLKNKDRKLQNEMARKDALHTKQRNVLKRKCEEAMAINKRLKDALERQKAAQLQRQKYQSSKDVQANATKISQLMSWLDRELEVIMSVIDGARSLEQLKEDREILIHRLKLLQAPQPPENTPAAQDLINVKDELKVRNTQITELEQKVSAINLEQHIAAFCEGIQNVEEARTVLKHILKLLSEMRCEYAQRSCEQKAALDGERTGREAAEERCVLSAKKIISLEQEHEKALAELENTYEEKIGLLLRQLTSMPDPASGEALTPAQQELLQIRDEQLDKMEEMRAELEEYKRHFANSKKATKNKKRKSSANPVELAAEVEFEESITVSDEESDVDNSDDPDWVRTPMFKRSKRSKHSGRLENSQSSNDTLITAASGAKPTNKSDLAKQTTGCKCRGNCGTKRCGCLANNRPCQVNCSCGTEKCKNGKYSKEDSLESSSSGNKMNTVEHVAPTNGPLQPHLVNLLTTKTEKDNDATRMNRFSTFETPRKGKFFE